MPRVRRSQTSSKRQEEFIQLLILKAIIILLAFIIILPFLIGMWIYRSHRTNGTIFFTIIGAIIYYVILYYVAVTYAIPHLYGERVDQHAPSQQTNYQTYEPQIEPEIQEVYEEEPEDPVDASAYYEFYCDIDKIGTQIRIEPEADSETAFDSEVHCDE